MSDAKIGDEIRILAKEDGTVMIPRNRKGDGRRTALICSLILRLASLLFEDIGYGKTKYILAKAERGSLVIGKGPGDLIVILASRKRRPGTLLIEATVTCENLIRVLSLHSKYNRSSKDS